MEVQNHAVRLGMWLFLGTEVRLFAGLFLGYTVYRWLYHQSFHEASRLLSLPLGMEIKNGTITYAINADIVNFSADRFLMSQKVESQILRAVANNQGYQIKGDMRIGGVQR